MPTTLSPLAKTLLDGFQEGVIVFNVEGRIVFANAPARKTLAGLGIELHGHARDLEPWLDTLGGRSCPLRLSELAVGTATFLPPVEVVAPAKLADQEKDAIVRALDAHQWKLSETAERLGISRTTLWRRLKAYGLHRDGRSKWAYLS